MTAHTLNLSNSARSGCSTSCAQAAEAMRLGTLELNAKRWADCTKVAVEQGKKQYQKLCACVRHALVQARPLLGSSVIDPAGEQQYGA